MLRRMCQALLVLALGVVGMSIPATAQAAPGAPADAATVAAVQGPFYVVNHRSARCANVNGASTSNGAGIIQWTCGVERANDLWYFEDLPDGTFFIWNYRSGKCLNVDGASTSNGADIIQWDCGVQRQNDRWYLDSGYIINKRSGKCLNVNGASTSNGAKLIQWTCGVQRENDVWHLA
jgi:cytochrome c